MKHLFLLALTILFSDISSKTTFNVHLDHEVTAQIEVNDGQELKVTLNGTPVNSILVFWDRHVGVTKYCIDFDNQLKCDATGELSNDMGTFLGKVISYSNITPNFADDILWHPGNKETYSEQELKDNISKMKNKFIDDNDGLMFLE
jgi:hypothetical protein